MIVYGNLGGNLVERVNSQSGQKFYTVRLAESFGKGEARTTQWIDLALNIPEEQADLLRSGMLVKVVGRVYPHQYDGKLSLKMNASIIEPYEARAKAVA